MTLDNSPPKLLYPDDYIFALIGKPGGKFEIYRSRRFSISHLEMAHRIRVMADTIELCDLDTDE